MSGSKFVTILSFIFFVSIFLSSSQNINRKVEWNTLKIMWGPDPLVSNDKAFIRQPRTVQQALQEGYTKLPNSLGDQCLGKTSVGHRYWKGNESTAILIYDKQGTIAGIQIGFPRSVTNSALYSFDTQRMYNRETINGIDMYIATAYFVPPATICSVGRTLSRLEHDGTGTGLFFQNGSNPLQDAVEVPLWENDLAKTKWVAGACFKTMGRHYWYNNHLDLNCSEVLPAFIMYNKGQLSAFGWSIMAKMNSSQRIEFPPKSTLSAFLITVPKCMFPIYDTIGGVSTMHLYFNTDPANLEC